MMGNNCHMVIYPINKINDLNMVCIIRDSDYNPENINTLIEKKVLNQNPKLSQVFDQDLKSWPLYYTPRILPSTNSKVFYIGDAFNGFLPTLAQGASQSIESAYELFNSLKENNANSQKLYFQERYKRAKVIRNRSNFNFFIFHISNPLIQRFRNSIIKFLIRRKSFIKSYLGKVYDK